MSQWDAAHNQSKKRLSDLAKRIDAILEDHNRRKEEEWQISSGEGAPMGHVAGVKP